MYREYIVIILFMCDFCRILLGVGNWIIVLKFLEKSYVMFCRFCDIFFYLN